MKLFLDTNIFIEFIGQRAQFEETAKIIDSILNNNHQAFISVGSLYTLTYLIERILKAQNIHRPEQTKKLRNYLSEVLSMSTLLSLSHVEAETAIKDKSFIDLEDCFQYHCAIENKCDVIITININDYNQIKEKNIEIMTPKEFCKKFL